MAQPKQTDPQFKLRLTYELKSRIEAAAYANNRSMNAEIVSALETAYPEPNLADLEHAISVLEARIGREENPDVRSSLEKHLVALKFQLLMS